MSNSALEDVREKVIVAAAAWVLDPRDDGPLRRAVIDYLDACRTLAETSRTVANSPRPRRTGGWTPERREQARQRILQLRAEGKMRRRRSTVGGAA